MPRSGRDRRSYNPLCKTGQRQSPPGLNNGSVVLDLAVAAIAIVHFCKGGCKLT